MPLMSLTFLPKLASRSLARDAPRRLPDKVVASEATTHH